MKRRRIDELPGVTFIPGAASIDLAVIAFAGGVVEELIDELRGRGDLSDAERRLAHALQGLSERAHVGDLARHQKLKGILRAGILAEIDQALVDDLRARFGGDVAAKVDVQFAGDLEIIGRPGIAHGVEQIDSAAAGDRDQRVHLGGIASGLQRFEVHPGQSADDFQMAQFLGADIHQQVLAARIVAVQALNGILHGSGEFAVGAAKLLEQHVAERGIGLVDPDRVHQLFDVVIHLQLSGAGEGNGCCAE